MKITETRILNWNDLRSLCVKHDWYTFGTTEEYANILDYASANAMTTEALVKIAEDIIKHTNPKRFAECAPNGTTPIQYVLFELADICKTFFHEEGTDFAKGNLF